MDNDLRKRERDWASGQETTSPEAKLLIYKRAGKLEDGVRKLSDDELRSLFGGWGVELAPGTYLVHPGMFFGEGSFDQERFDIWVFAQDRFPLRLQTDADVRWFNALPDEAASGIQEANIRRPDELLNPNLFLELQQNSENILFPIIRTREFLSKISHESMVQENLHKMLDFHSFKSHKSLDRLESFLSPELLKKPTRAEILRHFLESMPNVPEPLKRVFRERIMELISDFQN